MSWNICPQYLPDQLSLHFSRSTSSGNMLKWRIIICNTSDARPYTEAEFSLLETSWQEAPTQPESAPVAASAAPMGTVAALPELQDYVQAMPPFYRFQRAVAARAAATRATCTIASSFAHPEKPYISALLGEQFPRTIRASCREHWGAAKGWRRFTKELGHYAEVSTLST